MDFARLDALARTLASGGSRRRLLGALTAAPVLGGLLALLDLDDAAAKERRRRRKQRHKRRKTPGNRKKGCKPQGKGKVCAGKCGPVKSRQTCGKTVDCGSCNCNPLCGECLTCQGNGEAPGTCVPQQDGTTCDNSHVCCSGTCQECCDSTQCANPKPICASGTCEACSVDAQCGVDALCVDGACHACNVTCSGNATDCGDTLKSAIAAAHAGNSLVVCSGTYAGGFSIDKALTVIGAGDGADPTTSTVLDGGGTQRVVHIPDGTGAVELVRLHITRGYTESSPDVIFGAGLYSQGTALVMRDCTIAGNEGDGIRGAGIAISGGSHTLTRCTIRENEARNKSIFQALGSGLHVETPGTVTLEDSQVVDNYSENVGGGMYIVEGSVILTGTTTFSGNSAFQGGGIFANGGTLEIAETCRVTRNEAFTGTGGGIRRNGSAVTLQGLDPSPIVVENCHENCVGGVPKCAEEPVYCPEP